MSKQALIDQIVNILNQCDKTTVESVLAVVSRLAEAGKEHALSNILETLSELL